MIQDSDPWRSPPRCTSQRFHELLLTKGKGGQPNTSLLAERDTQEYYDAIRSSGVDPLFVLGMMWHESQFGTDGMARTTKSWGNTRPPSFGVEHIGVVNNFSKYATWLDGCISTVARLIDPSWVYHDRIPIKEIFIYPPEPFKVWAPLHDSNNPRAYVDAVIDFMNLHSDKDVPMPSAQIGGFQWKPADSRHFTKGRASRIKGFAVHYTGGSNSLDWLTTSPNSNVSATFLIKHQPTLIERGWQLVQIEDTPHTTGAEVNAFTISFEFEQLENQAISEDAYTVMAQTIVDCRDYLLKKPNLGGFYLNREDIKGHKEWVGDNRTCPDGISVDYVVTRAQQLSKPPTQTDPNVLYVPETNRFIVNIPDAHMLDAWYAKGGLAECGWPLLGMTKREDGVYEQVFENVMLECYPDTTFRYGGLGQRYVKLLEQQP